MLVSGLTKWTKILLLLPAAVDMMLLLLLRLLILAVMTVAFAVLTIVDFFFDIVRDV